MNSPRSLGPLGKWFVGQVESRPLTAEEKAEDYSTLTIPIDLPEEDLTNRTFSLAVDIGMYLGEVLRWQHPQLEWHQILGSKNYVDYGQPVLIDFFSAPMNPVHIAITLAYAAADNECDGDRLREVYETWSELALGGSKGKPKRKASKSKP